MKKDEFIAKIIKAPFTTNENYIDILLKIKKLYGCDYSALNVAFNFGYAIGRSVKNNQSTKSTI